MKTNFAKFQEEQFEKRNKVAAKAPIAEVNADVSESTSEVVAEEVKKPAKKSFFNKKK